MRCNAYALDEEPPLFPKVAGVSIGKKGVHPVQQHNRKTLEKRVFAKKGLGSDFCDAKVQTHPR
jgi:hypothetical protein